MTRTVRGKFDNDQAAEIIRLTGQNWKKNKAAYVARSKMNDFSGGIYNSRTMANRDCDGTGPAGAFRIGRQVCYTVDSLCEWLIARLGA